MTLSTLRCSCGSPEVISVAPGSDPVTFGSFTVSRGVPDKAWCRACWFRQFGPSEPTIMDWLNAMQAGDQSPPPAQFSMDDSYTAPLPLQGYRSAP